MMRASSIIGCCVALFGATSTVSAQSAGDVAPQGGMIGPALPSLGEFRADYSGDRRRRGFDRAMPQFRLESADERQPQWFDPTIVIAGAKIAPDVKRKGLKVAIPVELLHSGHVAEDQGSRAN